MYVAILVHPSQVTSLEPVSIEDLGICFRVVVVALHDVCPLKRQFPIILDPYFCPWARHPYRSRLVVSLPVECHSRSGLSKPICLVDVDPDRVEKLNYLRVYWRSSSDCVFAVEEPCFPPNGLG